MSSEKILLAVKKMREDPFFFIKTMWGLEPQKRGEPFISNKHITWQQAEIIEAVKLAIEGKSQKRIAVKSGHGIGKSCVMAWLLLWFLMTRRQSQIPCTAPTSEQMYDVLWKEVSKWLERMPEAFRNLFDWSTQYVRIKESPQTWFARAKTARKEAPEALAGVHANDVMMLCDEASGIPEEIFTTAEGALTTANIIVLLISNPTRLVGYFHDCFNSDNKAWKLLGFSSEDSPIVDNAYTERIIEKYGKDSDEYRVRVLGEFPRADTVDLSGYVALLDTVDLRMCDDELEFVGDVRLGVDPAGEGNNKSVFTIRDRFKSKIVCSEEISNAKSIAQRVLTIQEKYKIDTRSIYVDSFGVGAKVLEELALTGRAVKGVNVGEPSNEKDRFLNLRAELYYRVKEWLRSGGELCAHEGWQELLTIRYRPTLANKIQIMTKQEMRRAGYASPDFADALMLTFYDLDDLPQARPIRIDGWIEQKSFNRFEPI